MRTWTMQVFSVILNKKYKPHGGEILPPHLEMCSLKDWIHSQSDNKIKVLKSKVSRKLLDYMTIGMKIDNNILYIFFSYNGDHL